MEDFDQRIEALQSELLERRLHTVPFGRWSAYQHGAATFRILEAWARPELTQLAGLAMAASCSAGEHDFVRDLIGDDADRLAGLAGATNAATAGAPAEDGDPAELGEANAIRLAQLADRSCAEDGSPSRWLALASQLAAMVASATVLPPPVFARGTALVSEADERALIEAYRGVTESAARPDAAALAALENAAKAVPWVAEPLIVLGLDRLARADAEGAGELGTRACEILLSWNCAWDKRLSEFRWYALAAFLQRQPALPGHERAFSAQRVSALLARYGGSPLAMFTQLDCAGVVDTAAPANDNAITVYEGRAADEDQLDGLEFDQLPSRFQSYLARLSEDNAILHMRTYPSLATRPWWDPDDVAITGTVAGLAGEIFAELQTDARVRALGAGETLRVRAADELPAVVRLIAEHRDVVVADGVRLIALGSSSAYAPERTVSNVHLRCIAAVGGGETTVVVNGVADVLARGECLIFDPAFAHELTTAGDAPAHVLCVDVWHPELTPSEIQLLDGFARYVGDLVRAQQAQPVDAVVETVHAVVA
jgi:aspartyl/asparaginyl beta-hydroxylase